MDDIEIKFSSGFHELAGTGFSFPLTDQMSLAGLLDEWCAQNAPETLDKLIDPQTQCIAASTLITINGRSVKSDDPETTMVSPGDRIYITKILIGG